MTGIRFSCALRVAFSRSAAYVMSAFLVLCASSCGGGSDSETPADALVRVGDESLTRAELRRVMPGGLSPDDSTSFARTYIRTWIDARLIQGVASQEVDMEEIDRLTREYRAELIMSQYRRTMSQHAPAGAMSEDSVLAYYDSHSEDFRLERPLVRGVYLKVPDDASNLPELRRLYKSDKEADMDRLEKAALNSALHYDYFLDRWIDWEQIEKRIPADIPSADAFLKSNKTLDVSHDGFVYLLSVREYLPSGSAMPYEAAAPLVREKLLNIVRRRYDRELRQDLFDRSVADGTVVFPGANPLK